MRRMTAKITKLHWYNLGAFANPCLFRKANNRGVWSYFIDLSRPGWG